MKKALKIALLALLTLLACTMMLACNRESDDDTDDSSVPSQPHTHSYSDWEISQNPTCTSEGTKERSCICGDIQTSSIPETGHSFGNWTVTQEATCTVDGVEEKVCVCGEKETKIITATGHSFGNWTVSQAATCIAEGIEEKVCGCGEKETRSISTIEHQSGEWIVDKAASCTTNGSRHQECSTCNTILKTEKLMATGHKESNLVIIKQATCTSSGKKQSTCTICKTVMKSQTISATGHNYTSHKISATCKEAGGTQYTCTNCSNSYIQKNSAALGHNLAITGVCARCNGDYSVDMRTRISAPLSNGRFGFSFYGLDGFLMFGAEATNNTSKTIKYYTIELIAYNSVGDSFYKTTIKRTGPVAPGGQLDFNLPFADSLISISRDFRKTSKVKISYIKIEYTDGTVECGAYGYSTTTSNKDLYRYY